MINTHQTHSPEEKQHLIQSTIKLINSKTRMDLTIKTKNSPYVDDYLQNAFIKASDAINKDKYIHKSEASMRGWLSRIAHNVWIDDLRTRKVATVSLDEMYDNGETKQAFDVKDPDAKTDESLLQCENDAFWNEIQDILPPEQFQITHMRHRKDMKFKDIAEELNISINTALGRMRYALINLRKNADFMATIENHDYIARPEI